VSSPSKFRGGTPTAQWFSNRAYVMKGKQLQTSLNLAAESCVNPHGWPEITWVWRISTVARGRGVRPLWLPFNSHIGFLVGSEIIRVEWNVEPQHNNNNNNNGVFSSTTLNFISELGRRTVFTQEMRERLRTYCNAFLSCYNASTPCFCTILCQLTCRTYDHPTFWF